MNRREAISAVSILLGGTLIGADAFLSGCKASDKKFAFSADDISLLDDIGETIIPTTADSQGAKATKIGEFMKTWVNDCYTPEQQKVFADGIEQFKDACNKKYSKDFT
ncbi:MAG: gluconate 2-dehydrogenase subunit 3 family protein, partial [Chitinophagaceae bacterium]|nr:gluconate 2-dehydrogenase subunit 3 family protein [Chitinophagaceae bacterium]